MATDRAVKSTFNFRNVSHVIDVSVSEEQQFQIDAAIFQPRATTVWCVK